MSEKFKEQSKRIELIFNNRFSDISRRIETIKYYKTYLEAYLSFPVRLTGIEDFDWEEYYLLGPGDKREYEQLKLTQPSYKDIFSMSRIDSYYDEGYGLFAKITRLSDKKRFQLPLMDLKAVDKHSKKWELLDNYSVWFINYQ